MLSGLERLHATSTVLQRARSIDPLAGMWEAADLQWWWRRPRISDDISLPVWFDELGPVAAAGITAWDDDWQLDIFRSDPAVTSEEIWTETLAIALQHAPTSLHVLIHDDDAVCDLVERSGFVLSDEISGSMWMSAEQRSPVTNVDGFTIVDRASTVERPHPMIERNGSAVQERLRQTSLYDPTLDLAVTSNDGDVAGYALFWFDPTTRTGLLEPMRVEDAFQRRGLARMLITHGLDRLVGKGALRIKVGFESDAARALYLGTGFGQTSVDRLLCRPPRTP